jgi:hypothetical protein
VIRHFSSAEQQPLKRPLLPIAERWFPKPPELETTPGEHRFVWDLAAGSSGAGLGDPDQDEAAGGPAGPRVPPGPYTLRLIIDGKTMDRPLRVSMDPRCATTPAILTQQFTFANSIYEQAVVARQAMAELESVESQLKKIDTSSADTPEPLKTAVHDAQAKLDAIRDGAHASPKNGEEQSGLADAATGLSTDLRTVESSDERPAPASALEIFRQMKKASQDGIDAWQRFKASDLVQLNTALAAAHREPLQIAAIEEQVHYAMTR